MVVIDCSDCRGGSGGGCLSSTSEYAGGGGDVILGRRAVIGSGHQQFTFVHEMSFDVL